jgi:hypothetical protein
MGFAVAVFVLHFVANEDWWRRGESNPGKANDFKRLTVINNDIK